MQTFKAVCSFIFLLSTLLVWSAEAALVRGYVLKDSKRIAGVEVAFYMNQGEQATELARKASDENGRFLFAGPFIQPGMPFALAAFYKGVPYHSSTLQVAAQKEIIIEVFDTTSVGKKLHIDTHHLFVTLSKAQINVVHLVQMSNEKNQTFVGNMANGVRHVSKFLLDESLFDLQNYSGHFHQTNETTFFDSQPLPPGETQLSFSFNLDPSKLSGGYKHDVVYPTNRLEAFIQPTSIEISNGWEDLGVVDLHGTTYRRVLKRNLTSGESTFIKLPLPLAIRNLFKWVALTTCFVFSFFALWWKYPNRLHQSSYSSGSKSKTLADRRSELLLKIAQLDKKWAHEKDNPNYLEQRKKIILDAVKITKLLEAI
ncbi:MAG: hypothetical protein VX294_13890 [Candidatus Latescibacterota bacterium]|nr:hypothetical protein [Candidatus Latescibacterota bacterium]